MPIMNTKITSFFLILFAMVVAKFSIAAPLDARDDVGYVKQIPYASGWINTYPATGGNYVYGATAKNTGRSSAVFMIGKPVPQDAVFLTAQEEEGIWHYKQAKLEELRLASLPLPTKIQRKSNYPVLTWPRLIVEGQKVCVPTIAFSESLDWQDHLLCTTLGQSNGN
jgi:hypothetical protein